MTLNAMIEKRKKLLNTMDGFLDTHKGVNGVLSKEDDAVYAEMEQEFKDLTTEIQRMQRREEMEREMNKPINTPITDKIARNMLYTMITGMSPCVIAVKA